MQKKPHEHYETNTVGWQFSMSLPASLMQIIEGTLFFSAFFLVISKLYDAPDDVSFIILNSWFISPVWYKTRKEITSAWI